jgi:hypothetical protein
MMIQFGINQHVSDLWGIVSFRTMVYVRMESNEPAFLNNLCRRGRRNYLLTKSLLESLAREAGELGFIIILARQKGG